MKTLAVDDLVFEVRESPRRRTLEIIVDRDGSLVLAAPPGLPQADLEAFVREHILWVYTRLEEKAAQAQPQTPKEYVSGEDFSYLGRSHRLKVVDGEGRRPPLRLYQGRFELRRDAISEAKEHFIRWYTVHLRPVLDRHIAALAGRVGDRPRQVHVQDLGYRWGSSDKRRHVYFQWRVGMLPQRMIEYLVAHELVHLVKRYHTETFWRRLECVVPDYDGRRRWLRERGGMYDL